MGQDVSVDNMDCLRIHLAPRRPFSIFFLFFCIFSLVARTIS